jgi:predicted RNase H-like HicB family nuclease
MLSDYIRAAMAHAQYQVIPKDDTILGEIPGFEGVCAKAHTLEMCRHDLSEALEEWIFFRISRHLPVPDVDGVRLQVKDFQ